MKRILSLVLFTSALSLVWSSAKASSHSESPVRRGGQGCSAGQTAAAPTTVARPGHVVTPAAPTRR